MTLPRIFYIFGSKTLIYRKEEDYYISFDPQDLDFVKLNICGAEIMYLISKDIPYIEIIKQISNKYNIPINNLENDINNFFNSYSCKDLISNKLKALHFPIELI